MKKFLTAIWILIFAGIAYAGDLMENFSVNVRNLDDMNMSGLMPNYRGDGNFIQSDTPDFNLSRMKSMNPDFATYPNENGIIWLKYSDVESTHDGLAITRLYVILGRQGLEKKWLEWNIQTPADGNLEILLADAYDFATLNKITTVTPKEDHDAGFKTVEFMGLPEKFILTVAWKEILPKQLSIEGLCWFQEDLRVWESVVDIASPQELKYKTFPAVYPSEHEAFNDEHSYTWRRINIDPYTSNELARLQRQGVIFGTRTGGAALSNLLKEVENVEGLSAPADAGATPQKIISWLMKRPEIEFAEGTPRKIPSLSLPLNKREKVLLAKSWLTSKKIEAFVDWQLPFEPDEDTPLSSGIFFSPVLEYMRGKDSAFHDMGASLLIDGAKIFGFNPDAGKLTARRIPSSKSTSNRLSAIMNLKLANNGLLNGSVRVLMRGAWGNYIIGDETPDAEKLKKILISLFPDLKNYSDIKFKKVKGVPEISFTILNKPGVAGTGKGILAVLPFFEPVAVRKLGTFETPLEILFPFVIDQNINLAFPDDATEALISGRSAKNPDKINYSHNYNNRRHRLVADSRLEVGIQNISSGNMSLLQSCLDQWRAFSSRNIPIR
ncbi:MAG: hypothetical protein IJS40_06400 [Synergistaceae bacterium]|nr:hypothetical protein [Synergistaceae bacterium]